MDVEALTIFGTFGHTNRTMMVVHVDWLAIYQGATQDKRS
jgi:hypothetical protein